MNNIRNFSIIAHIDHGKSTLADRMLEMTDTVESRNMQEQVLDAMDLERERGITIKMQPVRMSYTSSHGNEYILNLIDTPGHIDFSYEVSRALKAVEGSIVLVDATQGVQAQTCTTLEMARDAGLVLVPVITKIDAPYAQVDDVKLELAELLECELEDIISVSGKTGEGVIDLMEEVVKRVPAPESNEQKKEGRALVFDFAYSSHQGIVLYVRVTDGSIKSGATFSLHAGNMSFKGREIGVFRPQPIKRDQLTAGEIGYIVTGVKEAGLATVGDTVTQVNSQLPALPGYKEPVPLVWASMYPEDASQFDELTRALKQLCLSDSSLTYEEERSSTLGRGFRCGFLGMLHLEIITERLRREFDVKLIVTTPSVTYNVITKAGEERVVHTPSMYPDHGEVESVTEPWARVVLFTPKEHMNGVMPLMHEREAEVEETKNLGDRVELTLVMPLRELMRGFFDEIKSVTSGYASISYKLIGYRDADVVRMDVLVAGDPIPALAQVVSRNKLEGQARATVEKLHELLPPQLFAVKIQAQASGRIWASETLRAMRKDVTGHLYGGDVTRKKKLLEKQKKGKKKMEQSGQVEIPSDVFLKMMQNDE